MPKATLYGIPHCDSVKRARAWLAAHHVDTTFHDFKKAGVPAHRLDAWIDAVGWERLLNRKGSTWRKLTDAERAAVVDGATARTLMLREASVIKRPVIEWAGQAVTVGVETERWPLT